MSKLNRKAKKCTTKNPILKWAALTVAALLLGVTAVFAFNIPALGKYQKVKVLNGVVSIPVARLSDGSAHFYKFEDGGKDITFFAIRGSDGSYKTAFDACDSCYQAKKGYEQLGDKMNCKNCNQKFAVNRLGPNATGGCNPGYLPNQQNGNNISVSANDLKAGARYF